jgi:hypothetical protein
MLLGLNGKLQSGKDTTYGIIKEFRPEAEKVTFAAKLKESAAAALGISLETLDWLKNQENIMYVPSVYGESERFEGNAFTVREYLQRVGTEAGRNVFGEDFWVDMALPSDTDHVDKLLVVTDMRFPNEIDRVIELGGYTVRLNRMSDTLHGNHPSEQDIDDNLIDWELDNTGTISNLKENVKKMLETFEKEEKEYAYSN